MKVLVQFVMSDFYFAPSFYEGFALSVVNVEFVLLTHTFNTQMPHSLNSGLMQDTSMLRITDTHVAMQVAGASEIYYHRCNEITSYKSLKTSIPGQTGGLIM